MSDKRKVRVQHFDGVLEMPGWYMDLAGVTLSHRDATRTDHVGLIFQPAAGLSNQVLQIFLSPDDATFLRDSLDEVFRVLRQRQAGAN